MINRTARLLLEIAGVAIGGVLVVAAIAIWRLSTAPVEARFIRPYLEQAINDAHLGFDVELAETRIEWHRFRPVLGLHFRGVSVLGPGGQQVGALREGTLGLSVPELVFGRLSVIGIDLNKPEITIVRDKDDHFSLRIGPSNAAEGANAAGVADAAGGAADFGGLLERFIEEPNDQSQFGRLRRVHLVDGKVTIDDRKLGISWSAPDVDIDIGRNATQTAANISVLLELPHHSAHLAGQARYIRAEGRVHLALNVDNFDAAAAAPLAQALSPLAALAIPVSGKVHAVLDKGGEVLSGDADMRGEQGQFVFPAWYPTPLALKTVDLKLHFTSAPQANAPQHLVLDHMAIDLGDARLKATGTADFNGNAVAIDAKADLADIPLARFDAIWPHGMAVGGRDWVTTHIPDGVIKAGTVHVVASGPQNDPAAIQTTSVAGAFDYSGMEVHYFPALPPIRAIAGHATFDATRMDLTIDSGMLSDIALSKGALAITGLDRDDRAIDIGLTAQGAVKSLLTILDMKPLGYAHDLGLAPEGVGGRLNLRVNFAFPLVKTLLFSQIALSTKGTLDGIAAAGVVGPRNVTDGALDIALDKVGMTLSGTARLSGVPVGFDWRESFLASDKIRSHISFTAAPDEADRAALALTPPDGVGVKGKIAVKGAVTIDRAHATTLDATADITQADIAIDKFGVRKPAGEAGTTDLSLVFDGDVVRHVPRLKIAAGSLNLAGQADFGADGSLQHAAFSRVASKRNDFALTLDAKAGAPQTYVLSLTGTQFDAAPLLNAKSDGQAPTHTPHLELTIGLDHLLTGAETRLDQVAGTVALSGGRLDRADLKAMAGGPLTLSYLPAGDVVVLHLAAADAGAALWDLGLTRGVKGGTLHLDGTTDPAHNPWRTTGTLDLRDFRLTDAPIAARLVNAVSPTGFMDLLRGQGLNFDRLSTEVDYADGKIGLRDGRSAGAFGISFEGTVDLDREKVALKGTIVPVDTFNKIVAAIPLIGSALTGGSRGGFLGWTYSVAGSTNDPQVSVNPLSVFAPGLLRNLFFLGAEQPAPKGQSAADPPGQQ
jgi:hypothetical protein